jgi:hypothetical protein
MDGCPGTLGKLGLRAASLRWSRPSCRVPSVNMASVPRPFGFNCCSGQRDPNEGLGFEEQPRPFRYLLGTACMWVLGGWVSASLR